jgi:hypothetical protein
MFTQSGSQRTHQEQDTWADVVKYGTLSLGLKESLSSIAEDPEYLLGVNVNGISGNIQVKAMNGVS